jgi:hypothetical protein
MIFKVEKGPLHISKRQMWQNYHILGNFLLHTHNLRTFLFAARPTQNLSLGNMNYFVGELGGLEIDQSNIGTFSFYTRNVE